MVDYSCAIKLSTPIAVISAVKEAADNDITIKGGKYLEAFANADTIVFDKTGTLTNAEPVLEKVVAFGDYTEDEVLRISACLEEHFPHSVANAVVNGAENGEFFTPRSIQRLSMLLPTVLQQHFTVSVQ